MVRSKRMKKSRNESCGMTHYHHRKTKSDWAGVSMGDAFKHNQDYYERLPAQRLFYRKVKSVQNYVIQLTGLSDTSAGEPKVKPQLSPFYTTYPSAIAAIAAVGLTGFLEYLETAGDRVLMNYMKEYLSDPASSDDHLGVDPDVYSKIVNRIARIVQNRLVLEDLGRYKHLNAIETYRLYAASQHNLKFQTVGEVLNALILYGDLLPSWRNMQIHPATIMMMSKLELCCQGYFDKLPKTPSEELLALGEDWVMDLGWTLAEFLPLKNESPEEKSQPQTTGCLNQIRYSKNSKTEKSKGIPALNKPQIPALFDPPTPAQQLTQQMSGSSGPGNAAQPDPAQKRLQEMITRFSQAVNQASGQNQSWEDMRSDIVEQKSRLNPFAQSPIQGNPTDGQQIDVNVGDQTYQSEIFDRPVELSDDVLAADTLIGEAAPITKAMKRTLYPNIERVPVMENLRTSGSLDPTRLAMAAFSNAVFKRYRMYEKADKRGRPVLVIACDGSGSLNRVQIKMLKLLVTAWMQSTLKSLIQILAGLYHSGQVRDGITGPLVQWMYHPQKTPSIGRKDAVRALVSLPDTGTGVQSDAPSIAFILQEAKKVARGRMIYLILLSDCMWNQSFRTEKNGAQEVQGVLESMRTELGDKLHSTLVALGRDGETGFEDHVDKVIPISADQLANPMQVARKIGVYVASCMKERTKIISRSDS